MDIINDEFIYGKKFHVLEFGKMYVWCLACVRYEYCRHSVCFEVKYFTCKRFYWKYFNFTVFGCLHLNGKQSISSVCFMVKWKIKNKK